MIINHGFILTTGDALPKIKITSKSSKCHYKKYNFAPLRQKLKSLFRERYHKIK
jgi:hypothetical protein